MVGPSPVQDAHACSLKNEFFSLICPLGGAKTTPPFFWHFLTAGCQAESVCALWGCSSHGFKKLSLQIQ